MNSALRPTLAQRLLWQVVAPVAAAWVLAAVATVGTAQLFAQRAFDRSLLDDAYLLASNMRRDGEGLQLGLSPREVNTVLFDQADTVYFSIRDAAGALLAGHPGLRMPAETGTDAHRFEHIGLEGKLLRAVTLHRDIPEPFDVTVAQTTHARDAMLRQLLALSLLPQVGLLALLAAWLWRRIRAEVQPLDALREAVEDRGADDLAPVDVTAGTRDVQALAAAVNSLLQRLDRSVAAQREFVGNVAHELRTPLAGIRALAEYGLAQQDPAAWREQLRAIAASEQRASALVDRLLALALAREAESRLTLHPVALDEVVRHSLLRFLPRADGAGVDLGATGIDRPVEVMADPTLLQGILDNLLDNALRYGIPNDGQPATVTVGVEPSGGEVVLTVHDNGPGAPGEQQAALVARGAQGEAGQLLGQGAGLGLALVAQYTRLMRGTMRLRTGPAGRGWACDITLPAAADRGRSDPPAVRQA
jgi:two-component system sensor histidine kinase TctE